MLRNKIAQFHMSTTSKLLALCVSFNKVLFCSNQVLIQNKAVHRDTRDPLLELPFQTKQGMEKHFSYYIMTFYQF